MSDKTRERLAESFRPDPRMDELLALRGDNPDRYDQTVDTATRLSVGYHESARKAAAEAARGEQS